MRYSQPRSESLRIDVLYFNLIILFARWWTEQMCPADFRILISRRGDNPSNDVGDIRGLTGRLYIVPRDTKEEDCG